MNTKSFVILMAVVALLGIGGQARALMLTPDSAGVISGDAYGPSNCEPDCIYEVFGLSTDPALELLYKADVGEIMSEEGTFAAWYEATFYNSESNPSSADIEQSGPGYITCPECYLAIKDGNAAPSYYFYDLGSWDGMEDINLSGFWPGEGAISHVSIWGRNVTSVPEPAPLALMGVGLLMMILVRRRRRT